MQKFLFGTLAGLFIPTAVFAQTATIPEGVGVADRARPDYKPIGGRIGSFFLYPVIDVSAEASDNVKASSTDRKSDAYAVISGNAKLQSNFSRHALNLQVHADQSLHARASSEDVTRYGVKLDGLYDISRDASLSALVLADHTFEERTSYNIPLDAIEPDAVDRIYGSLTGRYAFGRFDLSTTVAVRTMRYGNVKLAAGERNQEYRDSNVYSGTMSLGYRVRPGMRVIVRGVADKTNYTLSPNDPLQPTALNRDSKGLRVEGGFRFDITSLLYGEVRAGYFQRNYADPTLEDTSGLSFGADLLWNVTPLTTLKVGADRRVDEAASTTIAGNRTTQFDASVDHELLRNLILSGDFMYRRIAPLGPLRASDEFYARAGARILLNRQLSIRASYRYAKRNSNVAARAFSENRAMLAAVLTF